MERMKLLVEMLAWADVKNKYHRRISDRYEHDKRVSKADRQEELCRALVWHDFKCELHAEILAEAKKKNGYLSTWSEVKKRHGNGGV